MDSFRPSKLLKGKEVIILNPGLKCVTPVPIKLVIQYQKQQNVNPFHILDHRDEEDYPVWINLNFQLNKKSPPF